MVFLDEKIYQSISDKAKSVLKDYPHTRNAIAWVRAHRSFLEEKRETAWDYNISIFLQTSYKKIPIWLTFMKRMVNESGKLL